LAAEYTPLSWLLRGAGGGPLVLMYHAVSDESLPHIEHLYRFKTTKEFEQDLDFLLRAFRPATLKELSAYVLGEGPKPERAFYLTFDDGLREVADVVAPILLRRGLPATIFVSSGFVNNQHLSYRFKASLLSDRLAVRQFPAAAIAECGVQLSLVGLRWTGDLGSDLRTVPYHSRAVLDAVAEILGVDYSAFLSTKRPYMSAADLRCLVNDGFTIGSHSVDHPPYAELSLEEQLHQTREGIRQLRRQLEVDHKLFAFPFTDRGVGRDFFERCLEENMIDIFFGTSGWLHSTDRHLVQRVSLEGDKPAAETFIVHSMIEAVVERCLLARN